MATQPHPAWVPTLFTVAELRRALDVQSLPTSSSVELPNLPSGHGGILGAQLLGQLVALSETSVPGKSVRSMSVLFLRPSRWDSPLVAHVERLSDGRRFAALSIEFRQNDKLIARGDVLLTGQTPERVETVVSNHRPWLSATPGGRALWPWDVRTTSARSAAEVDVWSRLPGPPIDARESRALVAFASESLTVPLAIDMRGRRREGSLIPQFVIAHSVTYLNSFDASLWHRHRSRLQGDHGAEVTGIGEVFDACGGLLATTQTVAHVELKRTFA